MATLQRFENHSSDPVVGYEPPVTMGPAFEEDRTRWYGALTIAGERIFQVRQPCGTCGYVFRKLADPSQWVSDRESPELLGPLETLPGADVLERLAAPIAPGSYLPLVLEDIPRHLQPGSAEDYFVTDYREYYRRSKIFAEHHDPGTSYYQMGKRHALGRGLGMTEAKVFSFLVPLHDPGGLDRSRVEWWREQAQGGTALTAFAFSVFDVRESAGAPGEHCVLTSFLLDGHHRVQAAAERGAKVRVLAMLSEQASVFTGYQREPVDARDVFPLLGRQ